MGLQGRELPAHRILATGHLDAHGHAVTPVFAGGLVEATQYRAFQEFRPFVRSWRSRSGNQDYLLN